MVKEKKKQKICIIVQPRESMIFYAEKKDQDMNLNECLNNINANHIYLYEVSSYPHFD